MSEEAGERERKWFGVGVGGWMGEGGGGGGRDRSSLNFPACVSASLLLRGGY